jgi:hypothetical protein
MGIFAIGVEHPFDVPVLRPHHIDPRAHEEVPHLGETVRKTFAYRIVGAHGRFRQTPRQQIRLSRTAAYGLLSVIAQKLDRRKRRGTKSTPPQRQP